MLQLPILSLLLRTIPEGILVVWISYVLLGKSIDKKRLYATGMLFGIITYLIRMLPIYFGVHTILILIGYIFILHKINCINLYQAVTVCIISFILMVICEWTIIIIYISLGISEKVLLDQSITSILYGIPPLFLFFCTGAVIKYFKKARKTEVE